MPNVKHRQLPLCRLVRHMVSMWPLPLHEDEVEAWSSSLLSSSVGRRKVWTWPVDRPTETMGSRGWTTCEKRSADRGRVQTVSNMPRWSVRETREEELSWIGVGSMESDMDGKVFAFLSGCGPMDLPLHLIGAVTGLNWPIRLFSLLNYCDLIDIISC